MNKYILIVVLNDGCMIATKHEDLFEVMEEIESYNEEVIRKFEIHIKGVES